MCRRVLRLLLFGILLTAVALGSYARAAAAAELSCVPEQEPNDSPEAPQPVEGAFCIEGSISGTDQEILAWTIDAEAAKRPWAIKLGGPQGLQTRLQIHRLEELGDAENPAVVGPELVALTTPKGADSVERSNVYLTPGTWLIGISVSAGEGGAYRVSFQAGEPAGAADAADNSTPATAAPVANAFARQALLTKPAWYAWQLSGIEARQRWTLSLSAPLGASIGLALQTTDGKPLLAATRITEGRLELPDIGLPAGTYLVHIKTDEQVAYPFSLSAVSQGPRSPGREEELNDSPLTARPLTLGQTLTGRISQPGDVDMYVLPVAAAGQLLAIQVGGASRAITRLCVGGADGALSQCREGVGPSLSDIAISEKARFVTLSGGPSPDATYDLTVRASGQLASDAEAEPNDTAETANPLAGATIRGSFGGEDTDVFRFSVGDPNLRYFTVSGDSVVSVEVVNTQNVSSARADRRNDPERKPIGGPLELKDLALAPGAYFLVVSGRDKGGYAVSSTFSTPPAVVARTAQEREPNDAQERAQLLQEGERLSAELSATTDADIYRLSMRMPGGIALRLDTVDSCAVVVKLSWESWSGTLPQARTSGKGFVYQGLMEPGDYLVRIERDIMHCQQERVPYTLGYDSVPDIAEVGDVEPNDSFNVGRAMPPDLKVNGTVGQFRDADWYRLPKVDADTEVRLSVTGNVEVALTDGKASSSFMMSSAREIAIGDPRNPATGIVPAGATAAVRVRGTGNYTLEATMPGIKTAVPPAAGTRPALTASLRLERSAIAAYWHRGQRVAGALMLTNPGTTPIEVGLQAATMPAGWRFAMAPSARIGPGETASVPLSLEIEPDAFAARAVRVGVVAAANAMPSVTASIDIGVDIAVAPAGDHLTFMLPEALRGGLNIAWTALGGELLPNGQFTAEETLTINDGLGSNAGFLADAKKLPVTFTIRFGGARAWPVRGITINPQTPGVWPKEFIQDFELLLSEDGRTFQRALQGRVGNEPREQSFLLPEVKAARAAQLRVLSNHDGNLGRIGFSEWKVIADPAAGIGVGLNLADTVRGGHIVRSQPLISEQVPITKGVLEAGGVGPVVTASAGEKPQFTVGFNENRAAQVAAIEWTNSALNEFARYMPGVLVEASTETPLGPWTSLGEWQLPGEGRFEKSFEQPPWARFLRFTSLEAAPSDGTKVQFPTGLRVAERATDSNYRSILGEWGQYSPDGFYETTLPRPPEARPEGSANDTRETAEPLVMEETVSGRVELGNDEDWYRIVQPDGLDLLVVTLTGEPTVGADITLQDEAGKPIALTDAGGTPRQAKLEARVEPGKTYYLKVAQPPHSVLIAYDTSGSLLAFIPVIFNALEVFAGGVTPGREAVSFLPFDRTPMLRDFSDQPAVLKRALASDARESTTSGLENTAITAMRELATRRGTRAMLVITDAATFTTIDAHADMWAMVEQVRPRIFSAHIGSFDDPLREKQLLQDLSLASGGHYVSSRSQAELDVAFDRVAAWLRRPAGYTLRVAGRQAVPSEPGGLEVTYLAAQVANTEASAQPTSGDAIEILLDASGSMLKRMGSKRRIEIARDSLNKLVTEQLRRGQPIALRVFGHDKPGSCDTSLVQPLGPLDPDATTALVSSVQPQNLAKTPIAASLKWVADDLATATGGKTVILLTDGEETCGGDPRAEIAALAERDIKVRVNIVGFAVDDPALKGEFAEWARIGRGRYFDATQPEELDAAVKAATGLPFKVIDRSGAVVGEGTVGVGRIELPAGSYRVEIGSTPPQVFEGIVVKQKETTKLQAGGS